MSRLDEEKSRSAFDRFYNCTIPSSPNCFKSSGTYVCDSESFCRRIQNPDLVCTRSCEGIGLDDVNVVIADEQFGHILTAKCSKAYREDKMEVWPAGIKHKEIESKWKTSPQFLLTCNRVDWSSLANKTNNTGEIGK